MKELAFGGSTSSTSINRQLALHAAARIPGAEVTALDLRQYSLPIFSADGEEQDGIPADAQAFFESIRAHDAVVVSLAEHNGSYSAAFKNLYDWASRIDQNVWADKPMLLLSTSPGGRGGASVMAAASATFPRMGAEVRATFSLPNFYDNFSAGEGVTDPDLAEKLSAAIAAMA
ncbi:MAG: NAD(P)H-dependent oxidoreductase [Verrucomicrobiales bacterium]